MNDLRTPQIVLKELLEEAAMLEHCLLNTYLYAASSLKSTTKEFETIEGKINRRKGIQFERVRLWKQSILTVAHEEMLHLHYVQCMLRALGHSPCFLLPKRDKKTRHWVLPNWKPKIGNQPADNGSGMQIPLEEFSMSAIRNFVLYESTNSLQDSDPFGEQTELLFRELFNIELDLYFESALYNITDDEERQQLKNRLINIYINLTPIAPEDSSQAFLKEIKLSGLPPIEQLHFQSIGDLYQKGILPLYQQAFDFGEVHLNTRDLADELLDPNFAQEGFLPIGPVYRSKNFQDNSQNPLKNYKSIQDVINEIVEEGEGFSFFSKKVKSFLRKVDEIGTRGYTMAVKKDKQTSDPSPEWLANCESLRNSHLYKFAMIKAEMEMEKALAEKVNLVFNPVRTQLNATKDVPIENLSRELPAYFNACYLVLIMWLGRIYEIRDWKSDTPRRKAIESLASWPMMSMAIRPFLELASLLPVDLTQLFLVTGESIPALPVNCHQLYELYLNPERTEAINDNMDYLALKILSQIASWAKDKYTGLQDTNYDGSELEMVLTRLKGLSNLNEFEKQFPFRMYGGYSSTMPTDYFTETVTDPDKFEEDPAFSDSSGNAQPSFEDTLAIRLRFSGWGRVQLSTDPDPPTDESGCTGTNMLHADDGNVVLNRALVWQNNDSSTTINRQPQADIPLLGIKCVDASLLVTQKAIASFKPLGNLSSRGAVQTSGVQQFLSVDGFNELLHLSAEELDSKNPIHINLLEKSGQKPYLVGDNHLMWKDGEPIDPFIISVTGSGEDKLSYMQREIYNEGLTIREMNPVQRIKTIRWPIGFDDFKNLPEWTMVNMSATQKQLLTTPGFPITYLTERTKSLEKYLKDILTNNTLDSQEYVDVIASTLERLRLTSDPKRTTVTWLKFLLHYGHSVSGEMSYSETNNLFASFTKHTGLQFTPTPSKERTGTNSRWIIKYTKGIMDVDALSDFVFGELYIPVSLNKITDSVTLKKDWTFPEGMQNIIREFALIFSAPFWATYTLNGNKRAIKISENQTITETLQTTTTEGYIYILNGIVDTNLFTGSLSLTDNGTSSVLSFQARFNCTSDKAVVETCNYTGLLIEAMSYALKNKFVPK